MSITAERPEAAAEPAPSGRRRFPWLIVVALLVAAFLAASLPRYFGLDPARSIIPVNPGVPVHYPLIVGHAVLGSVALVTGLLQLWPWLRRRYPGWHRVSGRIYVFGGMLPTGLVALTIMPMGVLPLLGGVGATLWAVVAWTTTLRGWQAARQRRYAEHRRWMIYSFATALGPITGRLLFLGVLAVAGSPEHAGQLGAFAAFWAGWLVNLAIAHWWLKRHPATEEKPSGIRPEHH